MLVSESVVEFAHHGCPEAPSYEGAEDVLRARESSDGAMIDPVLSMSGLKRPWFDEHVEGLYLQVHE